jgi:galactokinase
LNGKVVVGRSGPVRQATELFRERFGGAPALCASAPGRVNLLGEHTDYNGGPVLPFAIDRRTAVAAAEDEGWSVVSQVDGTVRGIDPDRLEPHGWTAYIGGVIRVLRAQRLAPAGARLAVASSLPIGAGLSSSAALTVATARALVGLMGRRVPPAGLADIAYHAEHDEVGVRCGRMDQTVVAHARAAHAMLIETATGAITHVPFDRPVWLFDTGVRHRLADGSYNVRREECETALRLAREHGHEAEHLGGIAPSELPALLTAIPDPWGRRLRHVVSETARTRAAAAALARHDLAELGRLLVAGHESLRRDFESSCPEADYLVEAALQHGALGARLTGGGWGGAVVVLLPPDVTARAVAGIQEQFHQAFGRVPPAWATRARGGVRRETLAP